MNGSKPKKPRLSWVFQRTFPMTSAGEAQAISILHSLSTSAFPLVKNQPYETKEGIVQCFKCTGKCRYDCGFKGKLVHNFNSQTIDAYSYGCHDHDQVITTSKKGLLRQDKALLEEAVQDKEKNSSSNSQASSICDILYICQNKTPLKLGRKHNW